ncbi:MAG: hypothetical protein GC179_12530 [Anaerolineaceae bacterium]|nr:hypothetical protein [Anaerolineaceae bacterium]
MLRFYLRLALIPIALFTIALILIHTQPYDDHELRELLLPEGCPAPCFMGIRPGITTKDEAMKLLASSGWVEMGDSTSLIENDNFPLTLKWNGKQAQLLNAEEGFGLRVIFQRASPKTVVQITFNLTTQVSLGDVYLLLGKPAIYAQTSMFLPQQGYIMSITHQFIPQGIETRTITSCPLSFARYWHQPTAILSYGDAQVILHPATLKNVLQNHQCY